MTNEEKQYKKMTEVPVSRLVLQLGLPTTISMLITNLYNMADTWFVSRLNTSAAGAVGVIFGLMAIIQAFGFMFGHGAGSNISRLLGAHNKEHARVYSATSFYLSLACGGLILILGLFGLTPLCYLLGSTDTILPYARIYALYILISAPAMAASCVMNNILRYEGYAAFAMIGLTSGSIINIAGDALFMMVFDMGIAGAGLSTMLSQYISFGILLSMFLRGKTQSSFRPGYFTHEWTDIKNIVFTGFPSMMRQGLTSVSTMFLNGQAAIYGDAAVAAMSVVSRICNFLYSVSLGIGQGFQPVSSFNYGAGRFSRVKKAFNFTLCFGTSMMVLFAICGFVASYPLFGAFLNDPEALAIGIPALRAQCITLIFVPICICGNMLFQSIGIAGRATLLAALRSGLCFIPLLMIMVPVWGLAGIQYAPSAADILSAAITIPFVLQFLTHLPADEIR